MARSRGVKELSIWLDKVLTTVLAILIAGGTAHARTVMQMFLMAVGAGAPYVERGPDWKRGAKSVSHRYCCADCRSSDRSDS
jgi:hypothetical protein